MVVEVGVAYKGTGAETWRYWELEMKREEWGSYRDKTTLIRCSLHREAKLKLRFSELL